MIESNLETAQMRPRPKSGLETRLVSRP